MLQGGPGEIRPPVPDPMLQSTTPDHLPSFHRLARACDSLCQSAPHQVELHVLESKTSPLGCAIFDYRRHSIGCRLRPTPA